MTKISYLPPLRKNSISNNRNLVSDPKASASIPKPVLLKKSPRRKNQNSTEFDSPEYLNQQWNYLNHELKLLHEVVDPLQQQSDDLQLKCERMNYTPEVAEIMAKLDDSRQEKKKLDDDLATVRRSISPEILKEINIEVEELRGRFQFYLNGLMTVEDKLDIKKNQLDSILESDNVQFMCDYTQNYSAMRKRLAELKNENSQLESDLELLLNKLAEDPVEDKKITVLKRRLNARKRDANDRRNQLNKMRKEFEAKRNDLKEQIEKKEKALKAKEQSRNWKQNLNIEEEKDESEHEEEEEEASLETTTQGETTVYSTGYSYYDYEYSYECENPESSDEKKQETNEADKNDQNDSSGNSNFESAGNKDQEEENDNTFISSKQASKSIHKNGENEICFDGFVLLDVEPELDFDYGITNIHDDEYYYNEERLQNEENDDGFIKFEEETKSAQETLTREAIFDEQFEKQLDDTFEEEQNIKDKEEDLLEDALFDDEIGENDDDDDINNERKLKDSEELTFRNALLEAQEEEEENEELENEEKIIKEQNIKEDEEKLMEIASKERFASPLSVTEAVVGDIQPSSLFLTLAQQIENNEDIDLDEFLKHL